MRRRFISLSRPSLAIATAAFALLSLPAQAATPAAPQVSSDNLMKAMQNSLDSAGTGVDAPLAAPTINAPSASTPAIPPVVDLPAMAPPPAATLTPVPVAAPVQSAPIDTSAPKIVEPLKKDSYIAPSAVAPAPAPAPVAETPTPTLTAPAADAAITAPPGTDGVVVHEQKASESSPVINAPTKPEPAKTESAAAPAETKPAASEPARTDSNAPPLLSDMNEAPKMLDNAAANNSKQDLFVPAENEPAPVLTPAPSEKPVAETPMKPVESAPAVVAPAIAATSNEPPAYNAPYSGTRSLFGGPGGTVRQGVVIKPIPVVHRPKVVAKPAALPPETDGQVLYSQAATETDAKPEATPAVETPAKEAEAKATKTKATETDLISPPAKDVEEGASKVLYSQPAETAEPVVRPTEVPASSGKNTNFNKK